jgi:peptidoglycan/LPS O-acetylase OafA/YrhL
MSLKQGNALPPLFSASLDLMRLVAALGVFVSHLCRPEYSTVLADYQSWVGDGHEWVVVFLVISGFVVTHSTLTRSTSAVGFAVKRLSRLWSVVLPALVLTAGIDLLSRFLGESVSSWHDVGIIGWARMGVTALFLNEVWFLSAAPALNKPLWSISYEFCYYALFAALVFPRSLAGKSFWGLFVSLISGPKILLLLPCWGAGAFVWWICFHVGLRRKSLLVVWAKWLGLAAPFLGAWIIGSGFRITLVPDFKDLWFSRWFASDWLIAGVLAVNLIGLYAWALHLRFKIGAEWIAGLRKAADQTFAIYAFHYPMLAGCAMLYGEDMDDSVHAVLAGLVVLCFCLVGGWFSHCFHLRLLALLPGAR